MSAEALVERVLARARAAGAHSADALLVEGESTEVRVRGEEIEHVKQARARALGIRAFVADAAGLRQALTSTSDLSEAALDRLAEETVALARATEPDADAGLPPGGFTLDLPDLGLADPGDREVSVEQRIAAARAAEAAARAVDPRVVNSEGSSASSEFGRVTCGNTAGFLASYESAAHGLFSMPIAAQDGAMQTAFWQTASRRMAGLEPPEAVGRKAAERAVASLGARRVPTCEVPVVFDPITARSLLSNLASSLNGGSVYRGGSFLAGRLGERIAAEAVTVVDDGRLPGGLGSRPFDGEGLPTRRTLLVDRGRLASWLLDTYAGRKLGLPSTGNASRGAGGPPGPGPGNLWIEPGETSPEAMVQNVDRGLLVTSLFGHGFNPVTGDFSRGARGFWIEGGERAFPVEEVTVAGNLGELLLGVEEVGDDLLWLGRIAAPSLRIARLTVAGE